jgi:tetratricopeptide (TPR) repeat protein
MQSGKTKLSSSFLILPLMLLLTGCAAYQVGGEVQKGRMELLYGNPNVALGHFQRAAELDPNYRLNYSIFPEGVWTYVGRANFTAGMLPEARKALERARRYEADNLAQIYLGLVLARSGERDRGLREIETGLRGVAEWYEWVRAYHFEGRFWDPDRKIRGNIQKQLLALASREIDTAGTLQDVASLGRDIEIEIDQAKYHRDWHEMRKHHGDERRQ